MLKLALSRLKALRDQLHQLGQRPSMQYPSASLDVLEAMETVQQYSAMCEAMYLVMIADGRVLNVEREVLRGALEVLSEGRVRSAHMESMLDAAAQRVADQGVDKRLDVVSRALRDEPVKAEIALVLCAAVALADERITPEEQETFRRLAEGSNVGAAQAQAVLDELLVPLASGKESAR